ncbi:ABC transporter permease [Paenibacillus roseipurpureus]|uniref:ABC transporter permease subunit n=1 Tax=Paenibacillus roseopurpureus TaxID=2918901 RepID=A0AA96RM44_9BACL|nr:ABC transporter permease subunit [Paenibacillus sp. MBLB1832]WNR46071.1 ABC transporter permease subunit [Paenibacillus sp. MBLB1832]
MNTAVRRTKFSKYLPFYLLAAPGMIYFILFHYVPIWGIILAFQDYSPYLGVFKSEWIGFENFIHFFNLPDFKVLLNNTLILSLCSIALYFPFTVLLSLLLNELRSVLFKRIVQSVFYLPHFVSWVIIAGITLIFFGPSGVITHSLEEMIGRTVPFMMSEAWFRPLIIFQSIWRDAGWGTIIFLAALAGINPEIYEAGKMDGAGRLRSMWHITLPGIKSTIIILLLIRLGHALDSNFQQVFLMSNNLNIGVSDVFDLYVYRVGLQQGSFSFGVAVGLFKSIVSLVLVLGANRLAKWFGEDGIF